MISLINYTINLLQIKVFLKLINKLDFSLILFKFLDNNFFISPFSVLIALEITLFGAKGQTVQELKDVLCLNLSNNALLNITSNYFDILKTLNNDDTSLIIANKIFANNNFKLMIPYSKCVSK